MATLDDTIIFTAVIKQGGFSHAAKHLGLSNGLVSRRITQLEEKLGVTLIKRTTRQLQLTPEGQLFWQHAERIQQELDAAMSLIQATTKKPKGTIKVAAPLFLGRHYLTPIIMDFLQQFPEINIELQLGNQKSNIIQEELDLIIRGAGYLNSTVINDSSMKMKSLYKETVGLYASPEYLLQYGDPKSPEDLLQHTIINLTDAKQSKKSASWSYTYKNKNHTIQLNPKFNSNDIESNLFACVAGHGIGKFTDLNVAAEVKQHRLHKVLSAYNWGHYHLYALYPDKKPLPQRTRLLLDFIAGRFLVI